MLASRPSSPDLRALAAALSDAGVQVLVLGGRDTEVGAPAVQVNRNLQFLVRKGSARTAIDVVESMEWRYSWARRGLLRLQPMAYYWWDGGLDLTLLWGLPITPLPWVLLTDLTDRLWEGALPMSDGSFEPDQAALLVYLALQACRPGRGHEDDWIRFHNLLGAVDDRSAVVAIARRSGVSRAVDRALSAADAQADRPGPGPLFDGSMDLLWRLVLAAQRRVRPKRMRRLLAGAPLLGDFEMRCRTKGVETRAGAGVFIPTPDADHFVEMALDWMSARSSPTVLEIGTGCGAIALSLAQHRPDAQVYGTDLSSAAVRSARENASRLGINRATFVQGSLFEPLPADLRGRADIIIANLPFYPPDGYASIGAVPRDTIQGSGADGLNLVRQLARETGQFLRPGGLLLLQMFEHQWLTLSNELAGLGFRPGPPRISGRFAICPAERVPISPS